MKNYNMMDLIHLVKRISNRTKAILMKTLINFNKCNNKMILNKLKLAINKNLTKSRQKFNRN